MATSDKFIPGSTTSPEEIFAYPFFIDEGTKEFIINHGRVMFIIRGLPGTGKGSLNDLMMSHFPNAVKCSADDYFTETVNSQVRNRETLCESHSYCQRRVRNECLTNSHPLIVSNTHVRKSEMQEYLNLAAEYEYTVIICSTLDKFKVTPKILAKSNSKGLGEEYFKNRLQQWKEIFPVFMGWFICPDDSSYVHYELQCALNALLGDGKFCRVFDAFDSDTLLSNYKAKTLLCCMAGFVNSSPFELKDYYKSPQVRDSYGECFVITIQAFLILKSNIFAVVQLSENLKNLTFKPNFENKTYTEKDEDIDSIVSTIKQMSFDTSYNFKFTPLKNEFSENPKTAILKKRCSNNLDVNNSSFIHIAQAEERVFSFCDLNDLYRKSFMGISKEISADQFNTVENDYTIYRLDNDGWVIQIPKNLLVKTIFTGLYI